MTYWQKREYEAEQKLISMSIKQTEQLLANEYSKASQRLVKKLEDLYVQIISDKDALNSKRYQYDKYIEMVGNINKELKKLGAKEQIVLSKQLTNLYKKNAKRLDSKFGMTSYIDPNKVKRAVESTWVGKTNWSGRIWNNKAQLAVELQRGMVDCVAAGVPKAELTKTLMEKFQVGYRVADRLASTELSHIQNQSTLDRYKEYGVSKVQILTAHDDRTCQKCLEDDGKVFEIGNVPELPKHCWCRCCYVAVVDRN